MVYKCFEKKDFGCGIKNENISNKELGEELHNYQKIQGKNSTLSFFRQYLGSDVADIQLLNKCNNGICFLMYAPDIFSKYSWVISLKSKKGITITNTFQKLLDEFHRKPNKIRADNGSKFYNGNLNFVLHMYFYRNIYVTQKE